MYKNNIVVLFLLIFSFATAHAGEVPLKGGQSISLRIAGVPAEDVGLVSGDFSISDGGTVRLPYLKVGVQAAGLKPSDLARRIEAAYRSAEIYTAPTIQVSSTIETEKERFVSVLGEVKMPGMVKSIPGMTLIDAIARTGGFTDFAKPKKVKLSRGKKVSYHDLSRGDPKQNVTLQANDIVVVK